MTAVDDTDLAARLARESQRFVEEPEARRDPHPLYHELRAEAPVYRCPVGPYFVTGYDEVRDLLKDEAHWRREADAAGSESEYFASVGDIVQELFNSMMLWRDGDDHTRLRRIFGRPLTPRSLNRIRPVIEERADRLARALAPKGAMEVKVEFAQPLTMATMCDITGFDPADADKLTEWSHAALAVLESSMVGGAEQERAEQAFEEARDYLKRLVESRRSTPSDDLLTAVAEGWDSGELSELEAVGMALFLIIGGHDTTWKTLVNGIHTLVQHPEQYQLLREDPSLLEAATEEVLRYDSTARNALPRWSSEDVDLGGVTCPMGSKAVGMLNAANRDPKVFPDPDRFDITRDENRHIAFGLGTHFCSGATLARMMLQEGLRAITTHVAHPVLAETPAWGETWNAREVLSLHLRWPVD